MTTQAPEGIPGEAAGRETVPTERLFTSGRAAAYGSWPRTARRARSPTCADPSAPAHATPRWRPRDGSPQRRKAARRALRAAPARSGASGRGEGGPATCFRPGSARTPERHEEAGRAAKLRVACGERLGHSRLASCACGVCDHGAGVKGVPEARSLIEARRVPRRGCSIGEQLGRPPD